MTKTTIPREIRLKNWALEVQDFSNSGLSLSKWCATRNIPHSTFQYRLKVIREEMERRRITPVTTVKPELAGTSLVEAPSEVCTRSPEATSGCTTRILFRNLSIEFSADAPAEHLSVILEVIARA